MSIKYIDIIEYKTDVHQQPKYHRMPNANAIANSGNVLLLLLIFLASFSPAEYRFF